MVDPAMWVYPNIRIAYEVFSGNNSVRAFETYVRVCPNRILEIETRLVRILIHPLLKNLRDGQVFSALAFHFELGPDGTIEQPRNAFKETIL